ncbi:MAG: GatB/YqeY domain-containing protein [Acidobacteriota bacterium]
MSTPQSTIQEHVKDAMRARDKDRLGTLRMLLTEIKNDQIKSGSELDEDGFLAVVRRLVKQRKDSATQYRDGGRQELAEKEEKEIEILSAYLPAQASEDDLRAAIREVVEAEGLAGPKGIGPVMRAMMARFGAAADGATINRLAREILGS